MTLTATRRAGTGSSNPVPASEKQTAFLATLLADGRTPAAGTPGEWVLREGGAYARTGHLSKKDASAAIDALLSGPRAAVQTPTTAGTTAPLSPGMYRTAEGSIYRVQAARESGNLYAKLLVPISGTRLSESDERVKWEFTYAPGAMRTVATATRMSEQEAVAFGIQYGICCVCARHLKQADSVLAGIGPVCASRV